MHELQGDVLDDRYCMGWEMYVSWEWSVQLCDILFVGRPCMSWQRLYEIEGCSLFWRDFIRLERLYEFGWFV